MEQLEVDVLTQIFNTGIIGALFIILLRYVIYTERLIKKDMEIIIKQIAKYNEDSAEQLKSIEFEFRSYLKKMLSDCVSKFDGLLEKLKKR